MQRYSSTQNTKIVFILIKNLISYPGQACFGNDTCFTGECTEGKCPGAGVNETCTGDSSCLMGLYCPQGDTRTCQTQVANGGACASDTSCINTHGCNNGTCVAYFSLDNGVAVTAPSTNKWSLCASGEVDTTSNTCVSRTNAVAADTPCTAECEYTNADNTTFTATGSCKCAMNASGNKYCKLGSGTFII